MTNAFENAAKLIAQEAVKNAIAKLADRNGFDAEEALAFVMGTGVQIKKEILPRNALPWCGKIIEGDCLSLVYKEGLYTQCPQEAVEGENGEKKWCKKCAKQVAENGTPKNGDVFQRSECALMAYKVGKRAVIPYGDYMKRHKIRREEAEEAAAKYGITIDPVQFECKKRGRPTTTLPHMITPTQELPEAPEASQELAEATQLKEETKVTSTNLEEGELEEEAASPVTVKQSIAEEPSHEDVEENEDEEEDEEENEEESKYTAEFIESLVIADLRKLAESQAIATKENGKSIPIKQLRTIVMRKFGLY